MIWDKERWPSFSKEEVLSPDAIRAYSEKGILLIHGTFMDALQNLRSFVGHPFYINYDHLKRRGFRSHRENLEAGGAEFSFHQYGLAADVTCDALTEEELGELAFARGFMGVKVCQTFVHLDMGQRLSPYYCTKGEWLKSLEISKDKELV